MTDRILIVEDDPALVRVLTLILGDEDYKVSAVDDGKEAIEHVINRLVDLVILDIMLPGMDGWEVCQRIREFSDVPILVLTAKNEMTDRIHGLSLGVDDYLAKPFNITELLLRIRAILRRTRSHPEEDQPVHYDAGHLLVNATGRLVMRRGELIHLTPKEFKLLKALVGRAGEALASEYLLSNVWGEKYTHRTNYLKVYMRRLRLKIEDDPDHPRYILTERGIGYRFKREPSPISGSLLVS